MKNTCYVENCGKRLKILSFLLQEEIFLQKYKCTNISAYIHEKEMYESTKGLTYTLQKEIFCANVQMHKLGENLQQRFGNQSQRLQSEQPVAFFISSHILDILQCTSSTSLQNIIIIIITEVII